ncbi:MAG TPA: hypothetical protein VG963_11675 [Polyangiaceae bacterium]|nr:hypothetical protein [Polyangiaceae bacterium]
MSALIRHACRPRHDFSAKAALHGLAAIAFLASASVALPSAAQSGNGGTGGSLTAAGGTGGSGTGGSGGSGGNASGGSGGGSMTGAGGSLDDPGASCTSAPHTECPDRCPMFATCSVGSSMGQGLRLYYRVDQQRFDCEGLNCEAAVSELGDYCCERGKFAPRNDDDGGCALPGAGVGEDSDSAPWLGMGIGLCAAGFGLYRRRRARSQ